MVKALRKFPQDLCTELEGLVFKGVVFLITVMISYKFTIQMGKKFSHMNSNGKTITKKINK